MIERPIINRGAGACAVITILCALYSAFSVDPLAKVIALCALLVGCVTLGIVYWVNIGRPKRLQKQLATPGTAYFLVLISAIILVTTPFKQREKSIS